jgi:hypothetical protein
MCVAMIERDPFVGRIATGAAHQGQPGYMPAWQQQHPSCIGICGLSNVGRVGAVVVKLKPSAGVLTACLIWCSDSVGRAQCYCCPFLGCCIQAA